MTERDDNGCTPGKTGEREEHRRTERTARLRSAELARATIIATPVEAGASD